MQHMAALRAAWPYLSEGARRRIVAVVIADAIARQVNAEKEGLDYAVGDGAPATLATERRWWRRETDE